MEPEKAKETQEEKKPPFKINGVQWLSETIEINMLFRIKGKQGVFTPVVNPNKAGMILMERFMSTERHTIHRAMLEPLSRLVIHRLGEDPITLLDAFDNIQEHCSNDVTSSDEQMILGVKTQMNVICPKYDPDWFKDHHAKKIVKWYDEIITAINNATE